MSNEIKAYLDAKVPRIKQEFPKLYDNIVLFWGSKDFLEYIEKTVTSDRTNRQGFPPDIMQELFKIQTIHDKLYPQLNVIRDKWHIRNY